MTKCNVVLLLLGYELSCRQYQTARLLTGAYQPAALWSKKPMFDFPCFFWGRVFYHLCVCLVLTRVCVCASWMTKTHILLTKWGHFCKLGPQLQRCVWRVKTWKEELSSAVDEKMLAVGLFTDLAKVFHTGQRLEWLKNYYERASLCR